MADANKLHSWLRMVYSKKIVLERQGPPIDGNKLNCKDMNLYELVGRMTYSICPYTSVFPQSSGVIAAGVIRY